MSDASLRLLDIARDLDATAGQAGALEPALAERLRANAAKLIDEAQTISKSALSVSRLLRQD